MIYAILEFLVSIITSTIEGLGYFGVFILMTVESAGIPAPSEIIMPFSGFLVMDGIFKFWFLVFWGVLGNIVGSLIFYWVGLKLGKPFIESKNLN